MFRINVPFKPSFVMRRSYKIEHKEFSYNGLILSKQPKRFYISPRYKIPPISNFLKVFKHEKVKVSIQVSIGEILVIKN